MRDHDRAVAGKERAVEYEVDPLAGRDHRLGIGIRLSPELIAERSRRIHHHLRFGLKFGAHFCVAHCHAIHEALRILG